MQFHLLKKHEDTSRFWETAGSKSLVSVTSTFFFISIHIVGMRDLFRVIRCGLWKQISMYPCFSSVKEGSKYLFFLVFFMLVWRLSFPLELSLYTGIKYDLLSTALVHEAEDLPGAAYLVQPTQKLGMPCCSGAIHLFQLGTSIRALVDQQT